MPITIHLTPEQEAIVQQEANRRGQEPAEYLQGLVARSLSPMPSLTDLLAPFRQQVRESGVSDSELDDLIEEARQEVFEERRAAVP